MIRADGMESSREIGIMMVTSTPQYNAVNMVMGTSPHYLDSSGSLQSNNSSPSFAPHFRGKSNNTSGSSQRTSPASNSPSFSPSSPKYSESFPGLGSRGRHRPPQSPCLGDFIITKPTSQKGSKRIKPTQLTTVIDEESVNGDVFKIFYLLMY